MQDDASKSEAGSLRQRDVMRNSGQLRRRCGSFSHARWPDHDAHVQTLQTSDVEIACSADVSRRRFKRISSRQQCCVGALEAAPDALEGVRSMTCMGPLSCSALNLVRSLRCLSQTENAVDPFAASPAPFVFSPAPSQQAKLTTVSPDVTSKPTPPVVVRARPLPMIFGQAQGTSSVSCLGSLRFGHHLVCRRQTANCRGPHLVCRRQTAAASRIGGTAIDAAGPCSGSAGT